MERKEKVKEYPITVWLTTSQYAELDRYCEKYDLSKSSVIRNAIRKYLEI